MICKAADSGFNIIIVLAGVHNNLRSQTQHRLDEDFLGFDTEHERAWKNNGTYRIGVGVLDNNNTALVDKIADSNNQYDTFNVNEEVENVMNIINQLSEEDRNLITNLLIKNNLLKILQVRTFRFRLIFLKVPKLGIYRYSQTLVFLLSEIGRAHV